MGFISFRNLNFSEALSKERGSSSGGCAAGVLGNAPTVVAIAAAAFAVVTVDSWVLLDSHEISNPGLSLSCFAASAARTESPDPFANPARSSART